VEENEIVGMSESREDDMRCRHLQGLLADWKRMNGFNGLKIAWHRHTFMLIRTTACTSSRVPVSPSTLTIDLTVNTVVLGHVIL
jgi:hypothetical protein